MMAMMVEINSAYNKLSKEDKVVLFFKYAESLDYAAIAAEMELGSEDAARMRHNRAIKKLITRIGGFRPHLDKDSPDKVTEMPDEIVSTDDDATDNDGHQETH